MKRFPITCYGTQADREKAEQLANHRKISQSELVRRLILKEWETVTADLKILKL